MTQRHMWTVAFNTWVRMLHWKEIEEIAGEDDGSSYLESLEEYFDSPDFEDPWAALRAKGEVKTQ